MAPYKNLCIYKIESTVDGKTFVTARGWSDLSDMIRLCEENGSPVDEQLIGQYLQNRKIAKDFAVYYDLFNKYRADYEVDRILAGKASEEIKARAKAARFDERLSLLGLLLDGALEQVKAVCGEEYALRELLTALKSVRMELAKPEASAEAALQRQIDAAHKRLEQGRRASTLSGDQQFALHRMTAMLDELRTLMLQEQPGNGSDAFKRIKAEFDKRTKALKKQVDGAGKTLSNLFSFCEEVFPEGQELLILVTELTISNYGSRFISRYGCKEYFAHNKELLFYERQKEIITELESLDL